MIVVADTSPLNYLVLIDEIEVLHKLYGRVLIPPAVQAELLHPHSPSVVSSWMQDPPTWLEVRSPTVAFAMELDPGEAAAIGLAEEIRSDQIILDESLGRQEAARRGLSVIGTLGILRDGHRQGYLDIHVALDKLKATSFHVSPVVLAKTLNDLR